MVTLLRQAATRGDLVRVIRPGEVDAVLDGAMRSDWVVYTKHCLDHTDTVIAYLARYTHRTAITNARILALGDTQVTFRYKDDRDAEQHKTMRLDGEEFVRRFLLHVLPKGLMRIRHFGFLANRGRREKLSRIRQALAVASEPVTEAPANTVAGYPCPHCRSGRLYVLAELPPLRPCLASRRARP